MNRAVKSGLRYVDRFFRSGWKFLLLVTLALSALLIPIIVLLPPQYVKDVAITVTPVLTEFQERLGQTEPANAEKVSIGAANYLRNGKALNSETLLIDPVYDEATRRIEVHMESQDRDLLQSIAPRLVEDLETLYQNGYERDLTPVLDAQFADVEGRLRAVEEAPGEGNLPEISALEARRDYLARVQEDLPRIADEAVAVRLAGESEVRRKREPFSAIVAVVLLAFLAAVAGALRVGHPRGK